MSVGLIVIVTIIYAAVAANEAWQGHTPMAIVFTGYAFANIGLIMGVK